jgi:hypothetical protein
MRSDSDEFIDTAHGQIKPGTKSARQHEYLKQVEGHVEWPRFSFVNINIGIGAQKFHYKNSCSTHLQNIFYTDFAHKMQPFSNTIM